jgi:hypothetical protein
LPFLVTSARKRSYGIFTFEKLQDFYNIPTQRKIGENVQESPPSREKTDIPKPRVLYPRKSSKAVAFTAGVGKPRVSTQKNTLTPTAEMIILPL